MASILLDQNMPHGLRHLLSGHDVRTAYHMGWSDLVNGDLIAAAEGAGFDVVITADKNLGHQQNLAGRRLWLKRYAPPSYQNMYCELKKL